MLCIFQVLSGKLVGRLPYVLPGKEIPNGFEKANIRDSSVLASPSFHRCNYSVNIQLPLSTFDDLQAIILCVVFVPCEHYNHPEIQIKSIKVNGHNRSLFFEKMCPDLKYGKFESHHLWLSRHYLPFHYGWSIDEKEFHEVEFTIASWSVEVETVGFHFFNFCDSDYEDDWDMVIDSEKSSKEGFGYPLFIPVSYHLSSYHYII